MVLFFFFSIALILISSSKPFLSSPLSPMSATSSSIFKTLSMADSCLLSLPSIFTPKSSSRNFSIPAIPTKLSLSCAFSTSFSPSISLRKKTHFASIVAFVQTEGENTVTLEQEEGAVSFQESSDDAKIFVGNLPSDVDSERLAMLFEECGSVEIAEVIYNRETDRSRGFGFVTFSTVEEAEKAMEKMNGFDLEGRLLTVNKAAKRGERIERPPRTFQSAYRVYVGNISWDMDNSRLEQIFSEHGKVVDARVVYDRETERSRGFGFVTMADETGVNDVIAALDGQSIDGRTIRVNVAEQRPRRF